MRYRNEKTDKEEFEWIWFERPDTYVDERAVYDIIRKLNVNKPGSTIFLDFGCYEWGKASKLNPISRMIRKDRSKINKGAVKSLTKAVAKYEYGYLKLDISDTVLHCLPAFKGKKVDRLYISIGYHYELFGDKQLEVLCGLITDANQIDFFTWGPEHDNENWAQVDDIVNALKSTKVIKMFEPYRFDRAMGLKDRSYIHKITSLQNLQGINLDYSDLSDHYKVLFQRISTESCITRIRIERMKGFEPSIMNLVSNSKQNIEYSFVVEASGATEVRNFHLIWPMLRTGKTMHFEIDEDWNEPTTSFTRNRSPIYPVMTIIRAVEQEQISISRHVVDILLEDYLKVEYRNEEERDRIIGYVYPAMKMLRPEAE